MTNKIYPLPIAADYLSHWTVEDGVREILQNAIDSKAGFEYWWEETKDDNFLTVRSCGVQLHQSLLLLGSGTKELDTDDLGGFGEGFKLAFLTLIREGHSVTCYNGDKIWVPFFKESEDFGTNMLHVGEVQSEGNDLTFVIGNITDEQKARIILNTLPMQENYKHITTKRGEILPEHQGKVFVGGLFVCTSDLDYGYNFLPSCMKLNRDRKSVDGWDLKWEAQRMHFESTDTQTVAEMIQGNSNDMDYAYCRMVPESVSDKCHELYVEEHGDKPLANSYDEQQKMIAKGQTDTVYLGNENFSKIVKSSCNYEEKEYTKPDTPYEELEHFMEEYKEEMSPEALEVLEEILKLSEGWRN